MRKRSGAARASLLAAALIAAGGAPARPAARLGTADYVIAGFEGADPLGTPLRGYWYFFDDRYSPTANDMIPGNSAITTFDAQGKPLLDSSGRYDSASFPRGRGGEEGTRSLRVAYVLGNRMLSCGGSCRYDPFIAFGLVFTTLADTLDLTGATAITFWAKSDSDTVTFDVSVATEDTTPDAQDYAQTFAVGPAWTRCVIKLAPSGDFKQPPRSAPKPFNPAKASGLLFRVNRGANGRDPANALSLDEIAVSDWTYTGTAPDGLRTRSPASPYRRVDRASGIFFLSRGGRGAPVDLNGRVLPSP